jgi:capsular polysaccharide export protein
MIRNGWRAFAGKRVLLLQGPVGPFFAQLADILREAGAASVHKVNFNGGDWLFYPRGAYNHRDTMEAWPSALDRLIERERIDALFLFGDCRPIHEVAHQAAQRRNVEVWVFEEGYVRPNFVTLEPNGVNNHSRLPRDPDFYRHLPPTEAPQEREVGNTFWHAALWAFLYYTAAIVLRPFFPHYRHHRPLNMSEALPWLKSPLRKWLYRFRERGLEARLTGELSKRFFLVPLQVNTDFQVRVHSDFESVPHFMETLVASFARHAPKDHYLAFKHHPMDRGYHDYTERIARLAREHGLGDRLLYLHDQHLPSLLQHARGVAVINSTVGLSALHHGTPLMVLGDAMYDFAGLSFQGPLDSFWTQAEQGAPDMALYDRFRAYLVHHTQLNGSFYRYGVFDRADAADPEPDTVEDAAPQVSAVVVPLPTRAVQPTDTTPPMPAPVVARWQAAQSGRSAVLPSTDRH